MNLPYSDRLDIGRLSRLFDNMSECYKLFWFQAIVKAVVSGREKADYNELIDRKQTVNVDMSEHYSRFEKYLKPGGHILDLGCGSGRDSLYLMNKGYDVVPVDGSEAMCIATTELTGIKV